MLDRLHALLRRHREFLLRYVAGPLRKVRLLGPTWRLYERLISVSDDRATDDRGLAIPPSYLRVLVVGLPSAEGFLTNGRRTAERIRGFFAETGLDLDECDAVLDFGVGCGRVARHWPAEARADWYGCDVNPRLVAWVEENLPHVHASVSPLEPPTTYPDRRFDAVYAISVFTHLPEPLQHLWLRELVRLLRPGGRLLFTTNGDGRREVLDADELERFDRNEFIIRFGDEAGSNLCVAFHPSDWTRERLLAGVVDVLVYHPGGLEEQDAWVVSPTASTLG